jgi:DNA/RNA endonuclease YhcR with UshA esterase domain
MKGIVMKTGLLTALVISCAVLFGATPLSSHHSVAAVFDLAKQVSLTGTVTKIEWMNPHMYFYIDVRDATGTVRRWACEMSSPNHLVSQGWTQDMLTTGMTVEVRGNRARNGSFSLNTRNITADGKRLHPAATP